MSKKIFVDANIILDFFDTNRPSHIYSANFYKYALENNFILVTSCDIITTLYYIEAKYDKHNALLKIQNVNKTLKVVEFSNKEVEDTCNLMLLDRDYIDLEDTIQFVLAKKQKCDYIISNDKKFVSKEIKLLTSEEFCCKYNIVKGIAYGSS